MRMASGNVVPIATVVLLILSGGSFVIAQDTQSLSELFQQLKSPQTADQAAQQLLKLGRAHTGTRGYLAAHLPPIIAAGPRPSFAVWNNAMKLAG
jgi:CHASE3 domain sensor protein